MPEIVNGDRRWVYETASNIAFSDPETMCPGPSARLPVILDAAAHAKMDALVRGAGEYLDSTEQNRASCQFDVTYAQDTPIFGQGLTPRQ